MINVDKKKRNTSGSRSKSRKSKYNDFSVELKPHKVSQTIASHQHNSKLKTDISLNKSKGSRKHSKTNKKAKLTKASKLKTFEESKQISRSVSAERKNTLAKMNKTQANFQNEDFQHKIYALKKNLSKIQKPSSTSTRQINQFYQQIHESIDIISQPLYSFLSFLHELYLNPINQILEMISPYEELLQKKQMLNQSVEQQVRHNQQIYNQLQEEDLIIIRLKQKIEQQKQLIDKKKQEKQQRIRKLEWQLNQNNHNGATEKNMRKQKNTFSEERAYDNYVEPDNDYMLGGGSAQKNHKPEMKGLKINLANMDKTTMNFHDQFYSKIDEFSQSWRNQALRQKKF